MREIKFRGRRVDNGEWIYGFYTLAYFPDGIKKSIISISGDRIYNAYPIVDETEGQFIGLFDSNGKEIYEGDIRGGFYFCMEDKVEFLEVIKFHLSPHVGYYYYWESIKGGNMPDFMETEIIGNRHENPELLK